MVELQRSRWAVGMHLFHATASQKGDNQPARLCWTLTTQQKRSADCAVLIFRLCSFDCFDVKDRCCSASSEINLWKPHGLMFTTPQTSFARQIFLFAPCVILIRLLWWWWDTSTRTFFGAVIRHSGIWMFFAVYAVTFSRRLLMSSALCTMTGHFLDIFLHSAKNKITKNLRVCTAAKVRWVRNCLRRDWARPTNIWCWCQLPNLLRIQSQLNSSGTWFHTDNTYPSHLQSHWQELTAATHKSDIKIWLPSVDDQAHMQISVSAKETRSDTNNSHTLQPSICEG